MKKQKIKESNSSFIIVFTIFILTIIYVPQVVKKVVENQQTYAQEINGGSCIGGNCNVQNAYGYQVTLIKYTGPKSNGDPVKVGKPILIYHPDLLDEVTIKYESAIPTSYDGLESTNYGYNQILNPPDEHGNQKSEDNYENASFNDSTSGFGGLFSNANTQEQDITRYVDLFGIPLQFELKDRIYYTEELKNSTCKVISSTSLHSFMTPHFRVARYKNQSYDNYINIINSEERNNGYNILSQKFLTHNKIITYKGGKNSKYIDLSAFYKAYEEKGLNESNLEEILFKYYLKDIETINLKFGVSIVPNEIDEYYVQIEPVQRVFLNKEDNSSLYHISTLETKKGSKHYIETDSWVLPNLPAGESIETGNVSSLSTTSWTVGYNSESAEECNCLYDKKCPTGSTKNDDNECIDNETKEKVDKVTNKHDCKQCVKKSDLIFSLNQTFCGRKQRFYLYGKKANGYSTVVTSRSLIGTGKTSSTYLNRAVNYRESNNHCVLDNDDNCTGVYQHYIGPSLEKGLVGNSSTNYYKFGDEGGPTGIKHIYLIDPGPQLIKCSNTCQSINDKTSDEYLRCAENYCDAQVDYDLLGNPVKRKRKCILNCGYKYETTGCNKNPYQKDAALPLESKSTCNLQGGTKMQDVKGILVTCEGDNLTGNDDKDTIFDQRKYINVACKETTSFEYKDVNHEKVFAGKGIDYFVNQNGTKECTYYFNTTQWKFDYATIPSKDLLRRQRLKYIYTTFNNAYDKTYDPTTKNEYHYPTHNPYPSQPVDSELDFAKEHYGEIEVQKYDLDKTLVTSRVTEIVENKIEPSASQTLVRKDEKETTTLSNVGKDTLVLIENYKNIPLEYVNKYVSTSTATASYKYKKACIATDGTSDVKYYDETVEVCHTIKSGTNYKDVLAKNVYYTNLKATPNEKFPADSGFAHYFETTATVDAYYTNNEKCEYEIEDVPERDNALGCVVNLTPDSGAEKLGYNVFKGGQVKAKVIITKNDLPKDDDIKSIYIKVNDKDYVEVNDELVISKEKAGEAKEDFKIEVKVTTKKDKEYTALCENNFSLLKDSIGCTCVKKNDKLYEIIPNKTPREVMVSTLRNMKVQKVKESIVDSKYYVSLEEPLKNGNNIIGYVSDGSTITSCLCQGSETLRSCTEEFKPSKIGEITEYCYENYSKDINNYDSATDCISKCSNSCPNDQRNEEAVDKYCSANAISLGYDSINDCKNNCYNPYSEDGYLFRSIHNHDPFPNSPNSPYAQGNRGIGKNWYAKEEYITDDDNDKTSVTGDNANKQVEYIIDLNYNTIKMIRNENNNDGKEAYTTLIYSSTASDKNYVGEYKSKFLHDTLGGDIFKAESNKKSARYLPDDTEKQR